MFSKRSCSYLESSEATASALAFLPRPPPVPAPRPRPPRLAPGLAPPPLLPLAALTAAVASRGISPSPGRTPDPMQAVARAFCANGDGSEGSVPL